MNDTRALVFGNRRLLESQNSTLALIGFRFMSPAKDVITEYSEANLLGHIDLPFHHRDFLIANGGRAMIRVDSDGKQSISYPTDKSKGSAHAVLLKFGPAWHMQPDHQCLVPPLPSAEILRWAYAIGKNPLASFREWLGCTSSFVDESPIEAMLATRQRPLDTGVWFSEAWIFNGLTGEATLCLNLGDRVYQITLTFPTERFV